MLRRSMSNQSAQFVVIALLAALAFSSAKAWQSVQPFGHLQRYGGEADKGNATGQVEYAGNERRVRAGGQDVVWQQAQVNWMRNASGIPAMVFHVTPKDQNGDVCGKIRVVDGWSWGNLPGQSVTTKGCGWEADNEVRFYFDENTTNAGQAYWFQSLFKDTGYNGPGTPKEQGQVGIDSYWTNLGVRQNNDFHGKTCVEPDATRTPAGGPLAGCL